MLGTMTAQWTLPVSAGASAGGRTLVEAARQGDRAAFAQLHDRYAPMVHGILLARVPVDDADDLVQDIFLHAMRKLPMLRDGDAFGPWLAAIARSFAVRFHRKRRRSRRLPPELVDEARPGGLDESTRARARQALALILSLPEAYRETLILRLVEGLTGPQIARHTGLTPGSVRVNLHRGMTMLRARLREERSP